MIERQYFSSRLLHAEVEEPDEDFCAVRAHYAGYTVFVVDGKR